MKKHEKIRLLQCARMAYLFPGLTSAQILKIYKIMNMEFLSIKKAFCSQMKTKGFNELNELASVFYWWSLY